MPAGPLLAALLLIAGIFAAGASIGSNPDGTVPTGGSAVAHSQVVTVAGSSNHRKSQATGRCWDDSEYGLRSFACNGLDYQEFYYNSNHSLQNVHTGRCIDDSAQYGLRSFPCNGLSYQSWSYTAVSGLYAQYKNNLQTGRCIDDSNDFPLRSFTCNGQIYQRFTTA